MVKKFDFHIDVTPEPGSENYKVHVFDYTDNTDAFFAVSGAEDAAHVALTWLGLETNVAR
jgi:hypothetical protein